MIFAHVFKFFIQVDRSASKTEDGFEPAAAGTSDDSSLLNGFLDDIFQKRHPHASDSHANASKTQELFAFLHGM